MELACSAALELGLNANTTAAPTATSDRQFRISASDYALSVMTAPLLAVLQEEAPGISVEFDPLNHVGPVDLLRKDVVVASSDRTVPGKHQSLFSDTFVCLVRRGHPNLVDEALTLDDLNTLPYVDVTFADEVPMVVRDALMSAGVTPFTAMSVSGFLPVPFMIAGTDRYGFVPERIAELYVEPIIPENGVIKLSDRPGLGLELDEKALANAIVA